MTEVRPFALPDLGEGLTEADVVSWHVAAGDEVGLNQVLVEVETEKAVVELPSPFAGRVVELLAEAGETVRVGAPLILIDTGAVDDGAEDKVPMLVGYGPSQAPPSRRRNRSGHRDRGPGRPDPRTEPGRWPRRRSGSWPGRTGSTSPTSPATGPAASSRARTWPPI